MSNNQGWETYSKLVIQQLETLNTGIENMRKELQDVKEQITKIKAKEDRLEELKTWKDKTGCPMLLNTSLNIKGMPMVNDRWDARKFEEKYNVKVV